MNVDIKKEANEQINSQKLLEELSKDIAREFWIEQENTKKLLGADISKGLEDLKKEIQNSWDEKLKALDKKRVEKLFFTLKWALDVIEKSSKIEIKSLKEDMEKEINTQEFKSKIEDYLPKELVYRAQNAEKIHEHILWFALGTANSLYATADILYQIGKWILQTPYHLYMILSGKWEYPKRKDI